MKKLYVGKVEPKFEISQEQIEKYNLQEGSAVVYSGVVGCVIVSEDTKMEDVDIKEVGKKVSKNSVDIKEVDGDVDIKEVQEDDVDIKEI